jgi:hypothetical protein
MARKQESKLIAGPLPKSGKPANTGAIDNSTLPKPQHETWTGWASAPQQQGDDRNR